MRKCLLPILITAAAIAVAVMWRVNPGARDFLAGAARSAVAAATNTFDAAKCAWKRAHPDESERMAIPAATPPSGVATAQSPAAQPQQPAASGAAAAEPAPEPVKLPSALGIISIDPMKATWAVVRFATPVTGIDGSEMGTVAGGRFFEISSRFRTDDGLKLVGNFAPRRLKVDVEIPADAVYGFTGDWQRLSAAQRHALRMYYQLTGEIDTLRRQIEREFAMRSPHFKEAAEALKAFRSRAEEIEKSPNLDVEGKRKATYALSPLRQKVQELNEKHRAWKEAHAAEIPDPAKDPRIVELEAKRQTHARLIGGMAF